MQNLVNSELVTESVKGKVGQVVRKLKDRVDIEKTWNISSTNKKYSEKNLSDEDYDTIAKAFAGMRKAETFPEYKKHYLSLCNVTGIPKDHVVIVTYRLQRSKENNFVEIIYNVSPKKITIPSGSTLYHMSTCHTIDSLEPKFKGKSAKSYLYSSPRIYFTLKKNMNKFAADIKHDKKTTTYTPVEDIKYAYIDPLVPVYSMGAVFVETSFPIKVEKVDMSRKNIKDVQESVQEDLFQEPIFTSLSDFMEYYGLEFADDDEFYQEGVIKDKIGELKRKFDGKKHLKEEWDKISENISNSEETMNLPEDDKKELKEKLSTMKSTDNFNVYKKAHDWICKLFKIPSDKTVIEKIDTVDKEDDVNIKYNVGSGKKIIIPTDTELVHKTDVDNIRELKPVFKSKGKFFYPSKRVYFSLRKKGTKSNGEQNEYIPKEEVKTAYIDPRASSFNSSSIFIDTSLPIPVKKVTDKMVEEEKSVKENTIDLELNVHKYMYEGVITEDEKEILINALK